MPDKTIRKRLAKIECHRIAQQKLVNLSEYRNAKKHQDLYHILLVETDTPERQKLRELLISSGFHVIIAADGLELSAELETSRLQIDLIMLGAELPWVGGVELCKILKNHAVLKDTPVFLLLPENSNLNREETSADEHIILPYNEKAIILAIEQTVVTPPLDLS